MKDIDHDESQDSNEDADAFEQQLRSLRPSPPTQSWSSIAESIEATLDQPAVVPNVQPATSAWRSVVSHSITAAIGLALGVALMLTLPRDNSISTQPAIPPADANAVQLVDQQDTDMKAGVNRTAPKSVATMESSHMEDQHPAQDWRSHRLRTALRSGPLRAFGSISDPDRLTRTETNSNSIQNSTQQRESNDSDSSIGQPDDWPLDQPVLSPRSFHLFLDELTCLPTSNIPFCKAKGCQS